MLNWGRVSRLWKLAAKFWFLTQNGEHVWLFSLQASSMKHHLTETHEHNFEIHSIVLSSQSISLKLPSLPVRASLISNPLEQRFLTFYSNFPTLATTKLLLPPFPSPTYLKMAIWDIIGIDLFLLLQVYCWKAYSIWMTEIYSSKVN